MARQANKKSITVDMHLHMYVYAYTYDNNLTILAINITAKSVLATR